MKNTEAKSKQAISSEMGNYFVDAIYEGTTDETLTVNFCNALDAIAQTVQNDGCISPKSAAEKLQFFNPGKQYNLKSFYGHLGYTAGANR